MSDIVKYRAVSFKKDQIAALHFTMSDIVHAEIFVRTQMTTQMTIQLQDRPCPNSKLVHSGNICIKASVVFW